MSAPPTADGRDPLFGPDAVRLLAEGGLPPLHGDVVTGEAVVLGLRSASFASRLLAALIDAVAVLLVLLGVVLGVDALDGGLDTAGLQAVWLTTTIGCLVGIPVLVETLTRGRSLGKLALGTRVVRDDGGPVRFRHCVVRGLLGFFELWALLGSPAIICSLINARGKRFGDLLAGTYVIRVRTGRPTLPLPPMPPELAGWARNADIGRLPDGTAVAVRQFLTRAATLHPASRVQLGRALADLLLTRVAPAPPAGCDPESFLLAVLVERRDRELHRLQRQQRRTDELARSLRRD
ncbi:RDD family protein [Kineococcus gynurae]|uniref:RDD family protein n=1 Tax=Kineococcus gynurae TaxID=452979 RepID=A0ABV5LRA3_9ACTN